MKKYLISFTKEHNCTGKSHHITRKFSGESLMEIINYIKNMYDRESFTVIVEDIQLVTY